MRWKKDTNNGSTLGFNRRIKSSDEYSHTHLFTYLQQEDHLSPIFLGDHQGSVTFLYTCHIIKQSQSLDVHENLIKKINGWLGQEYIHIHIYYGNLYDMHEKVMMSKTGNKSNVYIYFFVLC